MKKILLLSLLLALASCSNQNQVGVNNKTSSQEIPGEKIVTSVKENNTEVVNKQENNVEENEANLSSSLGNTKGNITEKNITAGENEVSSEVSPNVDNKKNVYWEKYEKRFNNLNEYLAGISDEYKRISEMLDISCEEMCDLHIKDMLTKEQLDAANRCYKRCKKMQQDAEAKQEVLKKEIEKERKQYPKKCILNAEKEYEMYIKEIKEEKKQGNIPGDFKIPSKEEFIKFASEDCLVTYGYMLRNCDVIKEYENAYNRCKKILELKRDMLFIERRKGKTLDDFIIEERKKSK